MKKKLIAIIVLTLFMASTNTILFANDNINKGRISVNTNASTEIAPNTAEISFTIKTHDAKLMQSATLENKVVSEKVLNELNSLINSSNGDYIKTSDFSASPIYNYVNSKKIFDKYEVTNRVIVHTKSIDNLGLMIDKAILAGATNIDSLQFSSSDYESQCNDLITKATKKAKKRAETIAKALSTNIEGIDNITTSCNTNNSNSPRLYMAKNLIADVATETSAGGSTMISNGTIKINANVNASFFVK